MSKFNKLTAKGGLTKDDDNDVESKDVREMVVVRGIQIPLDEVSHSLRQRWHAASRKATRHARSQDELNAIGEAMLAERLPHMALKLAPRFSGHDAMAKMLGSKIKK
jgi:hypothetical protein